LTKGPYNPLDKINLARSIEAEVLSRDVVPLGTTEAIFGAGVYVIYYRGDFAAYSPIANTNKGLGSRLRKHADSIRATESLKIEDFSFRYIVLDDIWIPLGENILIETFKPLWNVAVEGFGINDPGKGRLNQKRSPWDVLHPGRGYAARLTGGGPEVSAVLGRIEDHFAGRPLRALPKLLAKAAEEADDEDRGEV
jgi:hypothetical protein